MRIKLSSELSTIIYPTTRCVGAFILGMKQLLTLFILALVGSGYTLKIEPVGIQVDSIRKTN